MPPTARTETGLPIQLSPRSDIAKCKTNAQATGSRLLTTNRTLRKGLAILQQLISKVPCLKTNLRMPLSKSASQIEYILCPASTCLFLRKLTNLQSCNFDVPNMILPYPDSTKNLLAWVSSRATACRSVCEQSLAQVACCFAFRMASVFLLRVMWS